MASNRQVHFYGDGCSEQPGSAEHCDYCGWVERGHHVGTCPTVSENAPSHDMRNTTVSDTEGCYICRPDDPSADEEACAECDREFWANPMVVVLNEEGQ